MTQSIATPIQGYQMRAITTARGGVWSGVIFHLDAFTGSTAAIRVEHSGAQFSEVATGFQSHHHLTGFRDTSHARYGITGKPAQRFARVLLAAHRIASLIEDGRNALDAYDAVTRPLHDLTLRDIDDLHHVTPWTRRTTLENAA